MTIRGKRLMEHVLFRHFRDEIIWIRKHFPQRPILLLEGAYDKWFWQSMLAPEVIAISLNTRNHVVEFMRHLPKECIDSVVAIIDADFDHWNPSNEQTCDRLANVFTYDAFNLESWLLSGGGLRRILQWLELELTGLVYQGIEMKAPQRIRIEHAEERLWHWGLTIGAARWASSAYRWHFRFRRLNITALLDNQGLEIKESLFLDTLLQSVQPRLIDRTAVAHACRSGLSNNLPVAYRVNGHDVINMIVHLFLKRNIGVHGIHVPADGWSPFADRVPGLTQTLVETQLREQINREWIQSTTLYHELQQWSINQQKQLLCF